MPTTDILLTIMLLLGALCAFAAGYIIRALSHRCLCRCHCGCGCFGCGNDADWRQTEPVDPMTPAGGGGWGPPKVR